MLPMNKTVGIGFTISLGLALAAACGGSASSNGSGNDGGGNGSSSSGGNGQGDDDSGGSSSSSSGGATSDSGIPCGLTGTLFCAEPEMCCYTMGAGLTPTATCATTCPDGGVSLACTKGSDCPSSPTQQVCCASTAGVACADSCSADQAQLCAAATDCPSGQTCRTFVAGAGLCVAEDAGEFHFDGGPKFEGGTVSEAGSTSSEGGSAGTDAASSSDGASE